VGPRVRIHFPPAESQQTFGPFRVVAIHKRSENSFPPGDRSRFWRVQPLAIALYTCQGIPMLWEGEEFGDDYNFPGDGSARVNLRRDTHWEYFYDDYGVPLARLYRRRPKGFNYHYTDTESCWGCVVRAPERETALALAVVTTSGPGDGKTTLINSR
jgi:hypothetical protein